MTISVGIGIANFPFDDARGFWEWVDVCDNGGVDSIWQSDRLISRDANLECMSVMAALADAMPVADITAAHALNMLAPLRSARRTPVRLRDRALRGTLRRPLTRTFGVDRALERRGRVVPSQRLVQIIY